MATGFAHWMSLYIALARLAFGVGREFRRKTNAPGKIFFPNAMADFYTGTPLKQSAPLDVRPDRTDRGQQAL
jgi:hypothetical protein